MEEPKINKGREKGKSKIKSKCQQRDIKTYFSLEGERERDKSLHIHWGQDLVRDLGMGQGEQTDRQDPTS